MPSPQVQSKMAVAVKAIWNHYVRPMHREGIDRGCVLSFNDYFRVHADFTTSPAKLAAALQAILSGGGSGGTRLYDSMEDMVNYFWTAGRRDCGWDAAVFVDVDAGDNRSRKYPFANPLTPEIIGRYIGTRFNHEPTNRMTLFGVGSGPAINAGALARMARFGNFQAYRIHAMPLLEEYLKRIGVEVTEEVEDVLVPLGLNLIGRVRNRHVRVARKPVDYCICLDTSGSMRNPAT